MKRFLGMLTALFFLVAVTPVGGADAATPKVGSKCTKVNQKVKVSQISFLCSKSGKNLTWVKVKSSVATPKKTESPKASTPANQQPTAPKSSSSQTSGTVGNPGPLPSPAPSGELIPANKSGLDIAPIIVQENLAPRPSVSSPTTSASSGPSGTQVSSNTPSAETTQASPSPSPSPSPTGVSAIPTNVIEKKPISLGSPTIIGLINGAVPSVGQVLTCSNWEWDQAVAQTIVSWIAYPSNTGSDIINPDLYSILSTAAAINESKLEISTSNIGKISGNYLYCFATARTSGGLETTSIAALLAGR